MKNLMHGQKGMALPMVLAAMLIFSILGVSVASYVSWETKSAQDTQYYLQGRYLAEAAIEDGIYQVKNSLSSTSFDLKDYTWKTTSFPPEPDLSPVFYHSSAEFTSGPKTVNDADNSQSYGEYRWYYVVPDSALLASLGLTGTSSTYDPGDLNYYSWVNYDGSPPTKGTELPTTGNLYPNAISFSRILLGQAVVFKSNGTGQVTRKILALVNFTFYPAQTPTPVTVVVTKWQDYTGSISGGSILK